MKLKTLTLAIIIGLTHVHFGVAYLLLTKYYQAHILARQALPVLM